MLDVRQSRAGCQIVLEGLDSFSGAFGPSLDTAVFKVTYVTCDLVTSGRALRKETIADPLYVSAY
jgi:hypothetical protein